MIKKLLGKKRRIVVIASGDPGYFGIARTLIRQLGKERVEIIPNITAFQAAFAAIKESWDDALLLSVHGRPVPRLAFLLKGHEKIGILTDSRNSPGAIAAQALVRRSPSCFCTGFCRGAAGLTRMRRYAAAA